MEKLPEMSYGEKLIAKRARVRNSEKLLWQAYSAGQITPDEMKRALRAMATQQIEELPCESYH